MTASGICSTCGSSLSPGVRICSVCGTDASHGQGEVATAPVSRLQSRPERAMAEVLEDLRQATLGEYEIAGELGSGGMATVYLAHEILADRKVAIKVMSPALLVSEGMVERFKREARTSAKLVHPHIVPIYVVRESGNCVFFVMRFLGGAPLDQVIKAQSPLPCEVVIAILRQVGDALAYAHRRGVVHRDIKPSNIMLDEDGQAVVTDFGIAKVSEAENLTATGAMVGTPAYMSPEQWTGVAVSGASDQYSLGCVAYEMLTGAPPFRGSTTFSLMGAHCSEPPTPLNERREDCPPLLQESIERMLAKDPAQRFPSMDAAVTAIGSVNPAEDARTRGTMVTMARSAANLRRIPVAHTPSSPAVPLQRATRRMVPAPINTRSRTLRRISIGVLGGLAVGAAVVTRDRWWPPAAARSVGADTVGAPGRNAAASITPARADSAAPVDSGRRATPSQSAGASIEMKGPADGSKLAVAPPDAHKVVSSTPRGAGKRTSTRRPSPAPPLSEGAKAPAQETPKIGFLSLVTNPISTVYVNGREVPRYPLVNYGVPAGVVRLRLQVTDSSGIWAQEREINVGAGDTVRLGVIRLVKP